MKIKAEKSSRMFGDGMMGVWFCPKYQCEFAILPGQLEETQDQFEWRKGAQDLIGEDLGPVCPRCGTALEYEEYDEVT